jgi:ferrous iron transport protein A
VSDDGILTLDSVPLGQACEVIDIAGEDDLASRLLEMGLIPGTTVIKVATAPLGDPIEFEVRGYMLSLRKSEAARASVKLLP